MIISQTPYRVSFAGGGTDLPSFYEQEPGAVLSVALAKHMYVTVSPRFERTTRVAYTKTEIADSIDELEHTLVRETLRMTGLGAHTEVTTIGDVPAGTGLGSSSCLTVGLLTAFYAHRGMIVSPERLASEACRVEIDILGKPIGKQDQYAAAFGGLNYIRFHTDGSVNVDPIPARADLLDELERWTLMMYTAQERSADGILRKQSLGTAEKMPVLRDMRDLAGDMRQCFAGSEASVERIAEGLDRGWELKRSLGFGISNERVDRWYKAARNAGALGGKLLGAGGGGFLLLIAPPEAHPRIREALDHPRELAFGVDHRGSRVIFISEQERYFPENTRARGGA